MAGLVLKNNVKEHWDEMHPSVQAYVKQGVLACVGLPEPYLRQTAGTCVTTIAYTAGLASWTELVPTLLGMLEGAAAGGAHDAAEGAIAALSKVCEDSCEALATQPESQPMLGPLLSTLIPLINATHEPLRRCDGRARPRAFPPPPVSCSPTVARLPPGILHPFQPP
eukprot:scaffold15964_cov135-Isochrysis_galbana.AAC.8